jgi:prevent-host-death family protein
MKEIPIAEFRANCFRLLKQVRNTRMPIRITRFGKPIAEIVPPSAEKRAARRLGSMVETLQIVGDIVGPTGSLDDWKAWRE